MRIFWALAPLLMVSCEILEEDISSQKVLITAPLSGSIVPTGEVNFSWFALQYATGYELTLVEPSFSHATRIVADTIIYADSLSRAFRFRTVLPTGDYQWRVVAFNSGYESHSEIIELKVEAVE